MKKPNASKESQHNSAKVTIITALITAATTIAVSFIGIVPQLQQGDVKKIEGLQNEINNLKQSVGAMSKLQPEGKSGTLKNQNEDPQAPHIQLRWAQIDPKTPPDQYLGKGQVALERSGFTGIGKNNDLIFGFDREYTGLVWSLTPGLVVFVVSGQDWQVADKKAENLRRGF